LLIRLYHRSSRRFKIDRARCLKGRFLFGQVNLLLSQIVGRESAGRYQLVSELGVGIIKRLKKPSYYFVANFLWDFPTFTDGALFGAPIFQ
jgi:hypothetical protein